MKRLTTGLIVAAVLTAGVAAGVAREPENGRPAASAVGTGACVACHADYDASISETRHRSLMEEPADKDEVAGCEACHGPGSEHLEQAPEGIVNFKREDGRDYARQCLTCHGANPSVARWEHSAHNKSAVFCGSCHAVHKGGYSADGGAAPDKVSGQSSTELCVSCHADAAAQFNQASRHPVPEGKMECVSCHNPHGDNTDAGAFGSIRQSCTRCHTEKSGPFAFPHDPAAQDCLACHAPHGSASPSLTVTRVPNLCIQCHSDALVIHNAPSGSASIRDCLGCHKKIHGSNASQKLFF